MKPNIVLTPKFVQYIPDKLEKDVLYISIEFATATHKCACGCGSEVVTPFSPTDWHLVFDGRTVSLDPSIGNWSFPCQSHYWITRNQVRWASKLSTEQINAGRDYDLLRKSRYFDERNSELHKQEEIVTRKESWWQRIKKKLF